MTTSTPRMALPFLESGQAQKEITHNEALARLDIVVQGALAGHDVDTPPADPQPGQCWLVGAHPTGDWSSHPQHIACWNDNGWRFVAPVEGMRFWLGVETGEALFAGGVWQIGEVHGRLHVGGTQVVGARQPSIREPSGGTTVDAEARQTVSGILQALRRHGLIEEV